MRLNLSTLVFLLLITSSSSLWPTERARSATCRDLRRLRPRRPGLPGQRRVARPRLGYAGRASGRALCRFAVSILWTGTGSGSGGRIWRLHSARSAAQPISGSAGGYAEAPGLRSSWPRGYLERAGDARGTDPAAGVILLTAHLDHLGIGNPVNGDSIYNGADDDASGTTAVLELARALSHGRKPKRTILFVLFGSEELGGYGNQYFLAHPPVPLTHDCGQPGV
jgi:hypothetical protein